jgi:hypothetical protein
MESGVANAATAVLAWDEAVFCDEQSISQSLRFPKVNVRKGWSKGPNKNGLKIKIRILKIKMKMVNVTQMRIKTVMLNVVAKCRGSVTGKSDPALLSSCLPISILNSVWVFLMAFTLSCIC